MKTAINSRQPPNGLFKTNQPNRPPTDSKASGSSAVSSKRKFSQIINKISK
jgi:hypothetical protein